MPTEKNTEDLLQANLFQALTNMTRSFVLEADRINCGKLLSRLDECMANGWILHTHFSLSASGPLSVNLSMISSHGISFELLNIDASPDSEQVCFSAAKK